MHFRLKTKSTSLETTVVLEVTKLKQWLKSKSRVKECNHEDITHFNTYCCHGIGNEVQL